MTIGTLRPLTFMRSTVDGEDRVVLGILRRHPVHIRCMAIGTARREISLLMVGRNRVFVVRLMAGKAISGRIVKTASGMTLGTV